MEKLLTIAVASDLHASPNSSAKLYIDEPDNPLNHPFSGLHELIKAESLSADLFLCPGDMTDKADPAGTKYAWAEINRAASGLGAQLTAATVGNHDLDSRGKTSAEEPKEILQQLEPPFPIQDESLVNDYWANHFTLYQKDKLTLVLLNSCVRHTNPAELERGYVTTHTLKQLRKRLNQVEKTPINVLLCHHHPHQHSELSLGHEDVMVNGQLLIDLLSEHGSWLIIHGHKHFPKLSYAAGGATSPIVFASGSFAGSFCAAVETRTRNQFHLIDVVHNPKKPFALYGVVRSWWWAVGSGWLRNQGGPTGMPPAAGFGSRVHPEELASLIAQKMGRSKLKKWSELCSSIPDLNFQIPQDYEKLKFALSSQHNLSIQEDLGNPSEVGRKSA